jgi:hypothetical protein
MATTATMKKSMMMTMTMTTMSDGCPDQVVKTKGKESDSCGEAR